MTMLARTYRARRFEDAIAQVRRDLGPDAVIFSSQRCPLPDAPHEEEVEVRALPATLARRGEDTSLEGGDELSRKLAKMGVPASAALLLSRALAERSGEGLASLRRARAQLKSVLEREMLFGSLASAHRGPRVVVMVGPTGAGKTTTLAKLAARSALLERRRTLLVSLDNYRIGGAEQLERYADLIGVPMEMLAEDRKLDSVLRRHPGAEVIYVDTEGRSPRDQDALHAMAERIHGAGEAVEVHLCVPVGLAESEVQSLIERHLVLRPSKLIATKLDEAVYHGSIVAAQIFAGLPYSYFTLGQRVPEDIEYATAERLAALLCGEELSA